MSDTQPGALRRLWNTLSRPSAKYSLLGLLVVGFIGGMVFWIGFNTAVAATGTMEFCGSTCHTMSSISLKEYKETVHYSNRSGVRVGCSDCHIPKPFFHKLYVKATEGASDIYHELMGTSNTPEKFEARRRMMAQHQWDRMKATDSATCRSCHSFESMSPDKQKPSSYAKHMAAKQAGKTCIDCHKGIAHPLPAEYKDPDE
jgi:cytochrome c-type protein NapC